VKLDPVNNVNVDRVYTKANMCYCVCDNGETYMWGDLSKGLSLESSFHQADMPVRSQKLEAYNFSEIVLTEESAIGIGSSVILTFAFPDYNPAPEKKKFDILSEVSKENSQNTSMTS
jgi:hypothetical protein